MKPFSPSAERNKEPILQALKPELDEGQTVLEIGSGTGQHICHFAAEVESVSWIPSDVKQNLQSIQNRVQDAQLKNVVNPIELDVNQMPWPVQRVDLCYTCNTLHIMSLASVKAFFIGCSQVLDNVGKIVAYGPFSIGGKHTAQSNAQFDQMLQQSDPLSGIRDINELDKFASASGFNNARRIEMPANNLLLVWESSAIQSA